MKQLLLPGTEQRSNPYRMSYLGSESKVQRRTRNDNNANIKKSKWGISLRPTKESCKATVFFYKRQLGSVFSVSDAWSCILSLQDYWLWRKLKNGKSDFIRCACFQLHRSKHKYSSASVIQTVWRRDGVDYPGNRTIEGKIRGTGNTHYMVT